MLARRLQRLTPPFTARMEDTFRVRLHLQSAPGSGAALCRWLRASSRRYHRPPGQPKRHERTRDWIKLGGKVTPHGADRWADNFDRLFRGIQFNEFDGNV